MFCAVFLSELGGDLSGVARGCHGTSSHGCRKDFFRGGIVDFSRGGGPKMMKFHFTNLKLREQPSLLKI